MLVEHSECDLSEKLSFKFNFINLTVNLIITHGSGCHIGQHRPAMGESQRERSELDSYPSLVERGSPRLTPFSLPAAARALCASRAFSADSWFLGPRDSDEGGSSFSSNSIHSPLLHNNSTKTHNGLK